MTLYLAVLAGAGALILLVAWLPMVLRALPLSLPMFCVGFGYAAFWLMDGREFVVQSNPAWVERLTEIVLMVALMGAGLKLDRPVGLRSWRTTWWLLGVGMPVCIALVALMGCTMLGFSLPAALLLGAMLAPTDPVLAADVQVGPPGTGEEDEVRFSLTSEAGLNDGLAAPFVNLALVLLPAAGAASAAHEGGIGTWFLRDVLWMCGSAVAIGWGVGRVLGWLTFHLPKRAALSRTGDGFVALGMTLLSFSLTQLADGYGFLAVFVTALALRSAEREHDYHQRLHEFTDQVERLLTMVVLVLFGGALANGLLSALTWPGALVGLLLLFVVRPLSGLLGMAGTGLLPGTDRASSGSDRSLVRFDRWMIAFFGVRGVGTFFYLGYAFSRHTLPEEAQIWSVVGFTVLGSILVHGATSSAAMARLDQRLRRNPQQDSSADAA